MYVFLIHNNDQLIVSELQKLHYMKSSVSEEADLLLKHIIITEYNYTIA